MQTIFKFCLTCEFSILTKHCRFLFGFYWGSYILDWSLGCDKRVYRKINNLYDSDDRNRGERKTNLWHNSKAVRKSHRLGNFAPSCEVTIRILPREFKSFTKKQEWYSIKRNVMRKKSFFNRLLLQQGTETFIFHTKQLYLDLTPERLKSWLKSASRVLSDMFPVSPTASTKLSEQVDLDTNLSKSWLWKLWHMFILGKSSWGFSLICKQG